jgi:hypothetical protein
VTGSDGKTARLWFLQIEDLLDLARMTVGRNFSPDEWSLYFPGEEYRKTFDKNNQSGLYGTPSNQLSQ